MIRAQSQDVTALGAAMVAAQAKGIDMWILEAPNQPSVPIDLFLPTTTEDGACVRFQFIFSFYKNCLILERNARYKKWKMAVQRSLGWATTKRKIAMTGRRAFDGLRFFFKRIVFCR